MLLYQRAGYGASGDSALARTPGNIALELRQLLEQLPHEEQVTLLGHSQGGLYVWKFARMYPELVRRVVLLDPLSPEDYRFRVELTEEEFKKSGADKTGRPKHCGRRSCGLMAPAPSAPSTAALIST